MEAEQILEKLIRIESVFGNEAEIAGYLESYLGRLGFRTRRQYFDGKRFNILAERGTGRSALLFYGHMDTVTPHGNWKSGPFSPLQEGDVLYGLGACDMKGGIAAMLKSLESGSTQRVKVLLCGDEENISRGAWRAVKEKEWFRDVKFTVSCEAGDSRKYTGGANVVTVGRRGRVVIEIDVYGLSSHAANPQRGVNAIDEAAKIVLAARKFNLRSHKNFGPENIFVRIISGSSESALDLPDKAHLEFDIQLVPPSTTSDAKQRAKDLVSLLFKNGTLNPVTRVGVKVKKRDTPYIEPYVCGLNNASIKRALYVVKQQTLRDPVINYGSSVADDNILANALGKPIITIGPSGGNEHAPNEWISKKSLRELVSVYEKLQEIKY